MSRSLQGSRGLPARLALAALLFALSRSLSAQEVTGTVRDGSAGTPLPGAMILLLTDTDRAVVQALSGRDGTYRLTAPAAGRYRLRVEHIGFENTVTDLFDLAAGAPVVRNVETLARAIELAGIEVSTARRCEVRPTQGAAAVVWEEARKALAAAAWTAGRDVYQIVWTRYEREIASTGRRILNEQRSVRQAATVQPFTSPDLEGLVQNGFVDRQPTGDVYAGPDANVLLSDAFLDTHCFALERRREGNEAYLGLRFAPVPGRRVPEVEGVMWLQEAAGRLHSVEYRYVNLGRELGQDDAFGELRFQELPNGTWIIDEWRIRIPVLVERQNQVREVIGYRVLGYHESGGLVNRVATNTGDVVSEGTPGRAVRGVVLDSLGGPAAGAHVWIEGASVQALADAEGAFELPGLGDGVWSLGASTQGLDAIGYGGAFTEVDVGRSDVQNLRLALPSVARVAAQMCADADAASAFFEGRRHESGRGILLGRVRDTGGAPAVGAEVRFRWNRYGIRDLGGGLVSVDGSWQERVVPANDASGFLLCNIPVGLAVRVDASTRDRLAPAVEPVIGGASEVLAVELVLSEPRQVQDVAASPAPGAADAPAPLEPSGRGLEVIGTLRDSENGSPVAAATLELLSGDGLQVVARTISNANGAFRLSAPAAGSYQVRASRLALDTITRGPVELEEGAAVTMSLETRAQPIELPAIDVVVAARVRILQGEGFYARQQTGAGFFMTPEEVSSRTFLQTPELMRTVPGLTFLEGDEFRVNEPYACPRGWTRRADSVCERTGSPSSRTPLLVTRSGLSTVSGVPCLPAIFVDGAQVQASGELSDGVYFDLTTIPASQILALEVFRSAAEVPAQYGGGSSACGVVLIWTTARLPVGPPA